MEEQIFLIPESYHTIWYSNPALLAPLIIGHLYAETTKQAEGEKSWKTQKQI